MLLPMVHKVFTCSLSLFQPSFEGEMPYVTTDYSFDLSGAGKLRVFKGLTRPSQTGVQWRFPHSVALSAFTFLDWGQTGQRWPSNVHNRCCDGWFPSALSWTEQPVSQTLQEAASLLLDLSLTNSGDFPQPPTVSTFEGKGFSVCCLVSNLCQCHSKAADNNKNPTVY